MDNEIEALADELAPLILSSEPYPFEAVTACLQQRPIRFQAARLDRMRGMYHGRIPGGPEGARGILLGILIDVRRANPAGFAELKAVEAAFAPSRTPASRRRPPSPVARKNAFQAPRQNTAAAAGSPTPEALPRTVENAVSGGVFHAPVIQAEAITGGVHAYYAQPLHSTLPPLSEWPLLGSADPIAFGVRRARRLPGESPLPPYVARHCDRELDDRVREVAGAGGLVVVTGAPLSGRTRTLWAALITCLPGATRILAPEPGTDLRGLPALLRGRGEQRYVLWLDDLEGHLGEHGLTPAVFAELVRMRVPVLATMDDEAYDARRFGASSRARVLDGARPVELNRVWSDSELQRLVEQAGEPRLKGAVRWRGAHTVPEYLATGHDLVEEWRRAGRQTRHPRGHLLVRAAIDLTLCGVPDGKISDEVLCTAHALYSHESAVTGAESFEEGLAWAAEPRHGVSGLLVPGEEEGTWTVFGALLADAHDRPDRRPVPLDMWMLALEAVRDTGERWTVRSKAHAQLVDLADGDSRIAAVLALINSTLGDLETAELWYRRAADAGHTEAAASAGELLLLRGATGEAIPYLEQAAEAGIAESRYYLGVVLIGRAHDWLSLAAADGHRLAAQVLSPLSRVVDLPPDTVEE
ncbi:sel1 repeat family protein [Streptomyces sp. NPDC057718]|uniref:sel1 repeat family protein n=1 Tax=Streptomyces sp. NPDC057718 TaxID=3346225 RepID=UPI0036BF0CDC